MIISLLNAILCAVIAYFIFRYHKAAKWMLLFTIAFAVFALSHLLSLFSHSADWISFIEFLRTIGYIAITYSLITSVKDKKQK